MAPSLDLNSSFRSPHIENMKLKICSLEEICGEFVVDALCLRFFDYVEAGAIANWGSCQSSEVKKTSLLLENVSVLDILQAHYNFGVLVGCSAVM
ncbi:uncharacterized protein A4U43_C08F12200 [Asparagus officinalis]|nr:uncharacterized protein A4U43_C08F12200 [Asparagus officinalis]